LPTGIVLPFPASAATAARRSNAIRFRRPRARPPRRPESRTRPPRSPRASGSTRPASRRPDAIDQRRLADADEAAVAGPDPGKRDGGRRLVERPRRVHGQLRLGDALAVPRRRLQLAAGLVVDQQPAAIVQLVKAVERDIDGQPLDLDASALLTADDAERRLTSQLHRQPFGEQPGQVFALQRRVTRRQRRLASLGELLDGGRRGGLRRLAPPGFAKIAHGPRIAAAPKVLHRPVQQRAALGGVEPCHRLGQRLRTQPVAIERPGRAQGLRAQQSGTAGNRRAFRHRRRNVVVDRFDARRVDPRRHGRGSRRGQRRRLRQPGEQRTGPQRPVALGAGIREHDLGRRAQQPPLHGQREFEFHLGRGMG
jgi:hypothetical protein